MPAEILLWYHNLGLDLAEGYGTTEILITHLPRLGRVRAGYVGIAFDGVEIKLGENGELLVRSPMNMLGYYKDPQGTRDAFTEDGFFRTGDIVHLEPDGQLKIVGRVSPFAVILLSEKARKESAARDTQKALEQSLAAQMEHVNAELDPMSASASSPSPTAPGPSATAC